MSRRSVCFGGFLLRREEACGMIISSKGKTITERMMHMMEWLKWKAIEWLVEHKVIAVATVRARNHRR